MLCWRVAPFLMLCRTCDPPFRELTTTICRAVLLILCCGGSIIQPCAVLGSVTLLCCYGAVVPILCCVGPVPPTLCCGGAWHLMDNDTFSLFTSTLEIISLSILLLSCIPLQMCIFLIFLTCIVPIDHLFSCAQSYLCFI